MKTNMTAVEWLEQQLKSTYDNEGKLPLAYTLDLVKQAKVMEKEKIKESFEDGISEATNEQHGKIDYNMDAEQYYNELYNKWNPNI